LLWFFSFVNTYQIRSADVVVVVVSCMYDEMAIAVVVVVVSCMYDAANVECLYALLEINKRIECTRRVRDHVTRNASLMNHCLCHPPCDEVLYDVSYSLSKWPAFGYEGDSAYIDIFYITNFTERFKGSPLKYKKMKVSDI